jgi:hypothetical protein
MGALDEAAVSDHPPPPAGSNIQVELTGETIRVVIPGRWTLAFWATLLGNFLFSAVSVGMVVGSRSSGSGMPAVMEVVFLGWGPLLVVWFFFVLKARTETRSLGRDFLETGGALLFFASRKARTSEVREFALKKIGPQHLLQPPQLFYGPSGHRKLLFAVANRDMPIAIQAGDAELEWLRGVLESHRQKLSGS